MSQGKYTHPNTLNNKFLSKIFLRGNGSLEMNIQWLNKLKVWEGKKKVIEIACQFWNAHWMTKDPAMTCTIPYS